MRSVEEIRIKWTTYMSETKIESSKTSEGIKADQRRTTLRDLTPFKETVIEIVGDTPIDGTPRGRARGTTPT